MKHLKNILFVVSILVLVWFVASWVDVLNHNLSDCVYQPWNLFALLF